MQLIQSVERFNAIFGTCECPSPLPVIALNFKESFHVCGYGENLSKLKVASNIIAYREIHGSHPVIYTDRLYRISLMPESHLDSIIKPDRSNWPEWAVTALAAGWTAPKGWKP